MKTAQIWIHLHGHDDDLEQLQAQFERFASFGVILVARAHEEVFKLPPQGLLLLLLVRGLGAHQGVGTRAAIVGHGGEEPVLLWETQVMIAVNETSKGARSLRGMN